MENKICDALNIDASQIRIEVTTTPKYRFDSFDTREMISFEIGIPIDEVIAMNIFFGIGDDINGYEYIIRGEVPSELLIK